MRVFVVATLASIASAGASLPAAAGTSDHGQTTMRDRASVTADDAARAARRRIARATSSDMEDYDAARPRTRRAYNADDEDRPRHTKHRQRAKHHATRHPKHATGAKHAGRAASARRHGPRRHAPGMAWAARPAARRATAPAWTRRNLAGSTPSASGQRGIASFYWQPQRVAAGGWFNPNGMTAAHRSLPFGTKVRVTHLGNGKSVDVRINDRGPYVAGRIIDLSKAAAGVIGMKGQGIARV